MGKGNAILGYASGAVGSFVFARVKGQQIIKGRNSKPHNKKSRQQILHRARLSTLYKFTRQLPPGLLDGAFDDQRPRENWQSCFIRHNTSRAIMQPKDWREDDNKPAFGKFQMSQGEIARDIISVSHIAASTYLGAVGLAVPQSPSNQTVAGFSNQLIRLHGLQNGDILTFVVYDVGPSSSIRDPKYMSAYRPPQILTASLRVNTADYRPLSGRLPIVSTFVYTDSDIITKFWLGIRLDTLHQPAMAVIVSRTDGNKVSCNTSYLAWPAANQTFWDYFESEEWTNNVLRSWGVSKTAILKGV